MVSRRTDSSWTGFRSILAISTWWLAYGKERRKEGFMKALTTSPHVGQNVVRSADAMWGL